MATKCPKCATFNPTAAVTCRKCGAELNPKGEATVSAQGKAPWYKRFFKKSK